MDAPLVELPKAAKRPKTLTLEALWFYRGAHQLVPSLLRLGVIESGGLPFLGPDGYRKVKSGERPNPLVGWVEGVAFPPPAPRGRKIMSNTSNFDFCAELSIGTVKQIFHLAFKNESQCFPHNIGPFSRDLGGGLTGIVTATLLDDDDRPADLSFSDDKHILFDLPVDLTIEIADAPDPALSRITLSATAQVPGHLDTWNDDSRQPGPRCLVRRCRRGVDQRGGPHRPAGYRRGPDRRRFALEVRRAAPHVHGSRTRR